MPLCSIKRCARREHTAPDEQRRQRRLQQQTRQSTSLRSKARVEAARVFTGGAACVTGVQSDLLFSHSQSFTESLLFPWVSRGKPREGEWGREEWCRRCCTRVELGKRGSSTVSASPSCSPCTHCSAAAAGLTDESECLTVCRLVAGDERRREGGRKDMPAGYLIN